jgi:hypothetical protein
VHRDQVHRAVVGPGREHRSGRRQHRVARGERPHRGRHQAVRQGGENPRGVSGRISNFERSDGEQGRHPPQDATVH